MSNFYLLCDELMLEVFNAAILTSYLKIIDREMNDGYEIARE